MLSCPFGKTETNERIDNFSKFIKLFEFLEAIHSTPDRRLVGKTHIEFTLFYCPYSVSVFSIMYQRINF
jgi:hypothetical protein